MNDNGLEVGKYCSECCLPSDSKRIKEMDRKSSDITNMSRKRHRAVCKGVGDADRVTEGVTYGPGMCEVLNDTNIYF